jgi:hypothetical protein
MLEITRDLPKDRPTSIYKHPKRIEPLYPFTGRFLGRPDAPVETDRTRSTASDPPTVTAPTVKPIDRMRRSTDRTRRSHSTASPRSNNRTRPRQRPNATVPASGWSPVSSLNDRTRPIACDQTRRASDQLYATRYTIGCPTGRAGPASD